MTEPPKQPPEEASPAEPQPLPARPPRRRFRWALAGVVFILGSLLGWNVWHYSQHLTGHLEPWEAGGYLYFSFWIFLAGLAVGLPEPRCGWAGVLGIMIGQLLYILFITADQPPWAKPPMLWLITALLLFALVPAVFGAGLAYLLHSLWKYR